MLQTVKKIAKLGVFDSFVAANDLPEFARYNCIYGQNGSGKTTLTRLLAALGDGQHPDYPDLTYEITSASGKVGHGTSYGRKVRVFNADFIEANIGQFEGPLRHILIVGEENKALAEEAKAEQAIYDARLTRIRDLNDAIAKVETDRGKRFSEIAKTISEANSGTALRTYRKQNAEQAFAKITDPQILPDAELELHRVSVHQEQQEAIAPFVQPQVALQADGVERSLAEWIAIAVDRAQTLTQRSAQGTALARLSEQPAIAKWVEDGLAIHRDHASASCEFCAQPLLAERMNQLAAHFGVEDQRLKADVAATAQLAVDVLSAIRGMAPPPRSAFYSEMREPIDQAVQLFSDAMTTVRTGVERLLEILSEKQERRTTAYEVTIEIDTPALVAAIGAVTALVDKNNAKTAAFAETLTAARTAIEVHYLSSIAGAVKELNDKISAMRADVTKLTDGAADLDDARDLEALKTSFEEKRAKVSSAHTASETLTKQVVTFLGRSDLKFESDAQGYRVERRGKPAKRLSEGEKTAIAFVYFLVQLGDQDFDVPEGVVVIDDPISSLDASAIYQAFSFLKAGVKNAKQVFILTHNFDFLRLLLNWHQHNKKAAQYYMIRCDENGDARNANIIPLDPMLRNYATEYHYLFKQLYSYTCDGTIANAYHLPNVARKVLETFLEFYTPSAKKPYLKLEEVVFDEHKKTAIYKFVNDQSHPTGKGFDPALVEETKINIGFLLEMIEALAPIHYKGLKALCTA
ncbi:AAA family ATPase [Sphingomonas adhaesiva]|uniref:AAA family ATPase n=1 Tax=Sphingomonas adhaesiva TaxID=28212 RepID=UPI002FF5670F